MKTAYKAEETYLRPETLQLTFNQLTYWGDYLSTLKPVEVWQIKLMQVFTLISA